MTQLEIGGTNTNVGPYNNPVGSVFDATSVSSTPTVSDVEVNISASSPNWKCGLYKCDSAGAPTDLIEQVTINPGSTGWQSIPFAAAALDNVYCFVCLKPDTSAGRPYANSGAGSPSSREKAHSNYAQDYVDDEFTNTFSNTVNFRATFTGPVATTGTLLPPPVAWI